MTDPAEDSKGNDEPPDSEAAEEPAFRTDGGEVAALDPGLGNNGKIGPSLPSQPEPPSIKDWRDREEPPAGQSEDTSLTGNRVGDLPDSIESHFTSAELQRLQSIAARTNAQSAWVIKRIFRNPEE